MDQSSMFASSERQVQPVQWAILIIVTLLTILIIVIPVILFILTRNGYTLAPTAGLLPISYTWKALLHYFFPRDPQDYELEKEKIRAKYSMRRTTTKP